MSGHRILIVEDDAAQQVALADRLTREGFDVTQASDGTRGVELAAADDHDLMILDVMLPGKDGFEVAHEVRSRGVLTPILMLTARGEVTDKVVGLNAGADDYLAKPYEFIELMARVAALLRRSERAPMARSEPVTFGDVSVDFRSAEVSRAGSPVQLSAKEIELLRYLVDRRGAVVSRDELLDAVWEYEATPTTRTVDVHVARLRQKLEPEPAAPRFLLTVRGLGYKLVADR